MAGAPGPEHRRGRVWWRGDEPEFGRLVFFTDAVYAIALTLLVLDLRLELPRGDADEAGAMVDALGELLPGFVAFGVAFWLLGRYWIAHHDFVARLAGFDRRLLGTNLVYLAFVALLPFPTSLISEYEANPMSVVFFAGTLSLISALETVLLVHARRADLLRRDVDPTTFRWAVVASLQPVVMFLATMPLAFWSTTGTLLSWAVLGPALGWAVRRRSPDGVWADWDAVAAGDRG